LNISEAMYHGITFSVKHMHDAALDFSQKKAS